MIHEERDSFALTAVELAKREVNGKTVFEFWNIDGKVICRGARALEQGFSLSMSRLMNDKLPSFDFFGVKSVVVIWWEIGLIMFCSYVVIHLQWTSMFNLIQKLSMNIISDLEYDSI